MELICSRLKKSDNKTFSLVSRETNYVSFNFRFFRRPETYSDMIFNWNYLIRSSAIVRLKHKIPDYLDLKEIIDRDTFGLFKYMIKYHLYLEEIMADTIWDMWDYVWENILNNPDPKYVKYALKYNKPSRQIVLYFMQNGGYGAIYILYKNGFNFEKYAEYLIYENKYYHMLNYMVNLGVKFDLQNINYGMVSGHNFQPLIYLIERGLIDQVEVAVNLAPYEIVFMDFMLATDFKDAADIYDELYSDVEAGNLNDEEYESFIYLASMKEYWT